jgi:hypothetical protein
MTHDVFISHSSKDKTVAVAALLLLSLVAGCGSDAPTDPEENTRAGDANAESIKPNNESNKSSQDSQKTLPEADHSAESNDSSPGVLAAALRGKVLRFMATERGRSYLVWMEFHANGTFSIGTDFNGQVLRKWNATGNQVTTHHGDDDQYEEWDWFVFSDPTLSVGSNIIILPSADAPESKGEKVSLLSVTDIPPAEPLDSRLPFTLSRETTHITSPLREDGYPDYVAAINEIASRDVTPENNAFIPLYELIYRPNFAHLSWDRHHRGTSSTLHDWFFLELGIKPFPEDRLRFRNYQWYLNQLIGRKEKLQPNKTGGYDLPTQHKNTYWRFHETLEKQIEVALRRPWKSSEFSTMAGWLRFNKKVLDRFRKATQRRRYYSPLLELRTSPWGLLGAQTIGTGELKTVANAVLVRATLNLGEGRIEEAIQDALACHRLGRIICQQPTTWSMIIGLVRDREACQADMLIAHHGKLTLEQLTSWRQELQRLPPLLKMVDMVEVSGRYEFLDGALSVAQYGPKAIQELDRLSGNSSTIGGDPSEPHDWLKVPFNRQLVNQLNRAVDWDEVLRAGHRRYDSLVAAARGNTYQERMQAKDKWIQTFIATSTKPQLNLSLTNLQAAQDDGPLQKAFTKSITDNLASFYLRYMGQRIDDDDIALMRNYLVGLSLSLAHYRLENGGYPENLSQLSPRYIGEVPEDYFVGQPLRYERKETGYLLYSQGPNRKDDRGSDHPYRGDIVFQVPLPALDK